MSAGGSSTPRDHHRGHHAFVFSPFPPLGTPAKQARAFSAPFRARVQPKNMTGDYLLFQDWYLFRGQKATPTKQNLGASQGLFLKFPTSTIVRFIWESPPRGQSPGIVLLYLSGVLRRTRVLVGVKTEMWTILQILSANSNLLRCISNKDYFRGRVNQWRQCKST